MTWEKEQQQKRTVREGGYKMRGEKGRKWERFQKIWGTCLKGSNDLEGVLHHYHLSIVPGKHTFSEGKLEERWITGEEIKF